jgi:hypothetical protein
MGSRRITLQPPLGGLARNTAYQQQAPFTTPDCTDVRPFAPAEGRARIGQRPGLVKAYQEQISGASNPIRLLNSIAYTREDGYENWSDPFLEPTLNATWVQPSVIHTPDDGLPVILGANAGAEYDDERAAVTTHITPDRDQNQQYEIFINKTGVAFQGKYRIIVEEADQKGYFAELIMTDATGGYSGSLKYYTGSGSFNTYAFASGSTGQSAVGPFRMKITGTWPNYTVTCTWQGITLLSQAIVDLYDGTTRNMGFGVEATVSGGLALVHQFSFYGFIRQTGVAKRPEKIVVASAGGELWRETFGGVMADFGGGTTLASDRALQSAVWGEKLYIADNSDSLAEAANGVIGGAANDELDSATYADWTALGIDVDDHVVELTSVSGPTAGVYAISSIQADHLHLTPAPGAGTCTFRVLRGPKIYDPQANTLTPWAATNGGIIPVGCTTITRYNDRLCLGGDPNNPHVWYLSRQGDPLDFDFTTTDNQTAVAGTSNAAGLIGEPIRAMIAHSDDTMVIGQINRMDVMRGDPAAGGRIGQKSDVVGILGPFAWARGPDDELLVMTIDGLYVMAAGSESEPTSVSRQRLPRELHKIDALEADVQLWYDTDGQGLFIFVTGADRKGLTHYWFDWQTKGFWPMSLSTDHEPTMSYAHQGYNPLTNAVLVGGRDGYIRRFSRTAVTDDGTASSSELYLGPVRAWDDVNDGTVAEMDAALGEETNNDVDWEIHVGNTAQAAFDARTGTAFASGTWTAGRNARVLPRARGHSFMLKLSAGAVDQWVFERIQARIDDAGRNRS